MNKSIYKLENPVKKSVTMKGWLARDAFQDGLALYAEKPFRPAEDQLGIWHENRGGHIWLDKTLFPELKWEDNPVEMEITLKPLNKIR